MVSMGDALRELAAKYDAARVTGFDTIPGGYRVNCDKGTFSFVSGGDALKQGDTPLLPWRVKRKFAEMTGLLKAGTVKKPLAIRVKNICPQSTLGGGLAGVLLREMDVCEQLLSGDKIVRVFAVPDQKHSYMNALCSTEAGVKISMELGVSPVAESLVEMHEIVCRTGIITDVAVDTQTEQYPIYVYGKQGVTCYTDTDFELYDMDETERDCVRFMLRFLTAPDTQNALRADVTRLRCLAQMALKGGACS